MRSYYSNYATAGQLKEAYEKNIEIENIRSLRQSYFCYSNCHQRCKECITKIVDCSVCDNKNRWFFKLWTEEDKICHICDTTLDKDWYHCSKCNSGKNKVKCNLCYEHYCCGCAISCCGSPKCSECIYEKSFFCDICQVKYCSNCKNYNNKHQEIRCAGKTCENNLCQSKGSYCLDCKEKYSKICQRCGITFIEEISHEDIFCNMCYDKYKRNHLYGKCSVCSRIKKVKNYHQRDKVSQPVVKICGNCKEGELRRCSECDCCILLSQRKFYYDNQKVEAYTATEDKDGNIKYTCCRPNCQGISVEMQIILYKGNQTEENS